MTNISNDKRLHRIIKFSLLAMFLVCAVSLISTVAAQGMVVRDVAYVKDSGERRHLDIYLPKGYKDAEKPLPVIVFLHGGYWEFGDKSHVAQHAKLAVKHGFAAVAVNYRFVPDDPMPAQIEDVKAAIRWMRANAKRYNLDNDRVGAWGYSAGAHLTALLCTMTTREFDVGGHLDQPSTVRCGVVVAGPTDFEAFVAEAPEIEAECEKVFGGDRDEKLELIRKMGAVNHVTKDSSPMLIFHAEDDDVVLVSQAQLLEQTMKKAGATCELHIFPAGEGGHGSLRLFDAAAAQRVANFFAKHVVNTPEKE